jgi:hypothetical protein
VGSSDRTRTKPTRVQDSLQRRTGADIARAVLAANNVTDADSKGAYRPWSKQKVGEGAVGPESAE